VTYFAGVYRRHTPFVLEAYDIPFLGQNVKFGSKSICRIPPQGDLIRGMTLKMTLPQLSNAQPITQWYWPIPPAAANVAQFVINSQSNTANVAPFGGITWYSTYNLSAVGTDRWLTSTGTNGPLSNWVTYSATTNKFTFSNVNGGTLSSVWVRSSSATNSVTNSGVFWGLDPLQASIITTGGGALWYGYTVTNNTLVANFTLEQAGWLVNPTPGLPPAASRTGMFLQSPVLGPTITSVQSQMALSTWTNWDSTSAFTVTQNNKIKIAAAGIYIIKVGLGLSSGSMANVAYGTVTNDDVIVGVPNFTKTYDWRVSPNPATPAVFPVSITNPNTNVYIYTGSSGAATLSPNSYVTVNQADDYFLLTSNISIYQSPLKVPFVSNIENTSSTTTTKATDGSLTWQMSALGTYLVTGVIQMSNGYVTSVTLVGGTSNIYTYDMSSQGRDPTFAFSMPLVVTDTTTNYYMNVVTSNTSSSCNIMAGSFFIFNQVGIPSSSTFGTQGVLPWSGLTFQTNTSNVLGPTSNALSSPLRIGTTDFVSNGYTYIESVSGTSNLQFSNAGTYVLTGSICTADQLTAISLNTWSSTGNTVWTSPISLGLSPPYTVNIPFRITDPNSSNTIIIATVNGSTAKPNIFSNTFISVYPFAINTSTTTQFSYYDSVGTLAVSSAELRIGGQLIQTLTGEAIELWNDLNVSYENQPALTVLTGKSDTSNAGSSRTYYVNLPFYFYGFPELSIPVVALDRQDIEVHVTFNNFSNLTAITSSQTPSLANPVLAATIITEYVYLSQPEIDWFRNNRIDQVITQWQYRTTQLPAGSVGGVFPLDFINPVRELFFVIKNSTSLPYDFSENGLLSLGLTFNGYDAFTSATTDATYLGVVEPYNHYNTFPQRQFYMYSFCENANTSRPTGFVNFSRIRQTLLSLNLDPSRNVARSFRVLGVNFNVLRIENGLAGLMFNSS
jgi:hypothetical protein